MPGKRVQIDDDTWASINFLEKHRMMTFQELFDEAKRDLLKKHGVPASLKEALRKSAAPRPTKAKTSPSAGGLIS